MKIHQIWRPMTRGLALFGGSFAGLNLAGDLMREGFDATLWWIDMRAMPGWLAAALAWSAAVAMLGYAIKPVMSGWRRGATVGVLAILTGIAVANALTVWSLDARGVIDAGFGAPFSLAVATGLAMVIAGVLGSATAKPIGWQNHAVTASIAGLCAIGFPLGQMVCFGKTDYRRAADAAVVFGCRAYADGRPSQALADRVATAAGLYHDGLVGVLIMSGGPGDGAVHETEAMRRWAVRLGVPNEAIVIDAGGLDTQRTVEHTAALIGDGRVRRLLAVSHFYHLPRVKMAYQRAGVEVYTVPAVETRTLTQMPYNMAREVAALWVYYLRPLAG